MRRVPGAGGGLKAGDAFFARRKRDDGDVEAEAYQVFETKEELEAGLESWSRDFYKHNVPTPANDFLRSEDDLMEAMGLQGRDLGLVVSLYGSASSFIDEAYTDAEEIAYQLAKRGITVVHGGGGRCRGVAA